MLCPLFMLSTNQYCPKNCLKEKCEWWDKHNEHCIIHALSNI